MIQIDATSAESRLLAGGNITINGSVLNDKSTLAAGHDLTSQGAQIKAGDQLALSAGHDLVLNAVTDSTSKTTQGFQGKTIVSTGQYDETLRGTTLDAANGVAISAGHDLTSVAGTISSANGHVALAAGNNINLQAGEESHSRFQNTLTKHEGFLSSSKTFTQDTRRDTYAVGTAIAGNNVGLAAGNDLNAQAAYLNANNAVTLAAGHDVNLTDAHDTHTETHDTETQSFSFFSTSSKRFGSVDPEWRSSGSSTQISQSTSVGSVLSGDSVTVAAGNNLTATNAQIVGTHDIVLAAGNNLTVNAGQNTYDYAQSNRSSRTGLMNNGGLSVLIGNRSTNDTTSVHDVSYSGSTVGSLNGSVTLSAGNDIHITGSDVLSNTGTTIVGKNVTIDAAVGTTDITQTQKVSQAGINVGIGGVAADLANAAYYGAQRGSDVKDDRLKTLYAAQAYYQASDAYNALQGGASQTGRDGGINLQIGIGGSSASSTATSHDDITYGSTIRSNGNVTIAATGGDLNLIGSHVAGQDVSLAAARNLNILSQQETHTLLSNNKNASGGVGLQIGTDGFGIYAQGSTGKGSAHGNGITHTDSTVDANGTLTLVSGNDTTIKGAQLTGDRVVAAIGNNLLIQSEQDTDDYASKQWQAGGKVVVGMGGGSGSFNYNQSKVDSHYASVNHVSGISAGSGGFDIAVGGNTHLVGGVIASSADQAKNVLDTGSLTYESIHNQANYSANRIGLGGSYQGGTGGYGPNGLSSAPGLSIPQKGHSGSDTNAGIAQGTIIQRDGSTDLSGLDRNPTLGNQTLAPIFDAQKVQENLEAGQVAGYVGMRTAGNLADYMATNTTTDAEKASWSDGGANKIILHGLVGAATAALGGGDALQGGAGAVAGEALSKVMADWLYDNTKIDPNSPEGKTLMSLASLAVGATVGGGNGAATALQGELYNRQLHQGEIDWIKGHAKDFASQQCGCDPTQQQVDAATSQLAQQAARQTDILWAAMMPGADPTARQFLAGAQGTFVNELGNAQQLFTVTGNQYMQSMMYLPDATANHAFYQQYVQPGVTQSASAGLMQMLKAADQYVADNPGGTLWNMGSGAVEGLGQAIFHPADTLKGAGQGLGENALYALNSDMVKAQLALVYGQDVSNAAGSLAGINSALALVGATGAGKGVGAAIEGAAKSAAVDAVKQGLSSAWTGDAAGLEKFAQSITGNVGSINRFLSADAVNATMDKYNWAPAWQSGTAVADVTLKPGTVVNMVVDEKTYKALMDPLSDNRKSFGGWATFDDVPTQAYARNELAITSSMKSDVRYVVQVKVTRPVNAQVGIVGEQPGAAGGGNQLHFNIPPEQRIDTFQVVGGKEIN